MCLSPLHISIKGNEDVNKAAKTTCTMTKANVIIQISYYLTSLKSINFNKADKAQQYKCLSKLKPTTNVRFWK